MNSYCHTETNTGLCNAGHDHTYRAAVGETIAENASQTEKDVQRLLASRYYRQENPYGEDHTAPVTNIWDAKSVRGRQFPPA